MMSLETIFCYSLFCSGSTADENLGQLHGGPSVDSEGKVFLSYSLGSICKVNHFSLLQVPHDLFKSEGSFLKQSV
jgi:hypothetical protein